MAKSYVEEFADILAGLLMAILTVLFFCLVGITYIMGGIWDATSECVRMLRKKVKRSFPEAYKEAP